MSVAKPLPSVDQVAQAFSQAAQTYDHVAGLQRMVADELLARGASFQQGKLLDLGSGTGYVSAKLAALTAVESVTGLDIAQGMLAYAQTQHSNAKLNWRLGDAQQLPKVLAASLGSYDLVVSSLAIQWCTDLPALFAGVAQCLAKNGVFHCTTLGPKTLHQLKWAWSQVDGFQHVNDFVAMDQLQGVLSQHFADVTIITESIELSYATVQQLIQDLKQLGASNHNVQAAPGLTGVGRLRKMIQAYESLRDEWGQLPVTYELFYIEARVEKKP